MLEYVGGILRSRIRPGMLCRRDCDLEDDLCVVIESPEPPDFFWTRVMMQNGAIASVLAETLEPLGGW
jgi:hypothetical protein